MKNPQTVLITGATSGIGRTAALHLAGRGYHVLASGRRRAALDELVRELGDGGRLDAIELDVTDPSSISAAVAEADRLTGGHGVDVLINNAGFGVAAPMTETTDADIRRQFDTNVFGLMAVTRAFVPRMRERGAGRVINVSSVGGRMTMPFLGAYNATKYAVESMSDALRLELRPFGIEVVVVEPGVINTNFADRSTEGLDRYADASSPYAPAFRHADELRARADSMGVGPEVIARALERAIRSRRPAARYVAPFKARMMLAFVRLLPTRWTDGIMRRIFHLNRRTLSAAATAPARISSTAS
jgi:NAD(P)-dependent dehydrogenase (short-subunit alcohol dehydrogenase family)